MKKVKSGKKCLPKYDLSGAIGNVMPYIQDAAKKAKKGQNNSGPSGLDLANLAPIGSMVGNALYMGSNQPNEDSDLTGSAIGMGLQGASMGMALGPLGALAGGALGAGIGLATGKARNIQREDQQNNLYNTYLNNSIKQPYTMMKEGGTIEIKESHKGLFTKYAKSKGMSVQEAAHWVMANSNDPKLRKQATFALNAAHFRHPKKMEEGGEAEDNMNYLSQIALDGNNLVIPQMGGGVDEKKAVPIISVQTEKGESIIMPDGGIYDVKAKDKHEKMDKDEVTDILPQGAYVAGTRDKQLISKKKAEKNLLGNTPAVYSEFDNITKPEEIRFSDIFKKEEHTPSEVAKLIKNKFKTINTDDDVLANVTNAENKIGRMPYLANLMAIVEGGKKKKKEDGVEKFALSGGVEDYPDLTKEQIDTAKAFSGINTYIADPSYIQPQFQIPISSIGGGDNGQYSLPEFGPTETNPTPSATPNGTDEISALYSNYGKQLTALNNKYQNKYSDYFKYARGANLGANVIGSLGSAFQSSAINPGLATSKYADEMYQKIPQFVRENNKTESLAPIYSIARNQGVLGLPTSTTMGRLAPMVGNAINTINQTNKQFALDDVNMDRGKAKFRQEIDNRNLEKIANAENRTTGLDNYKIAQLAGFAGRALTGDASLKGKEIGTMYGLDKNALDTPLDMATKLIQMKMQDQYMQKLKEQGSKTNPYQSVLNGGSSSNAPIGATNYSSLIPKMIGGKQLSDALYVDPTEAPKNPEDFTDQELFDALYRKYGDAGMAKIRPLW